MHHIAFLGAHAAAPYQPLTFGAINIIYTLHIIDCFDLWFQIVILYIKTTKTLNSTGHPVNIPF